MAFVLISLLGASCGSFISVVVERLDRRPGIMAGRSQCPDCYAKLAWYELIPILSFIVLRGRCRHCRKRISWRYPFLEIVSAVIATLWYRQYASAIDFADIGLLVVALGLFTLAVFDVRSFILPDQILLPLWVVSALVALAEGRVWWHVLLGAFLAGSVFGIMYLVSRGTWTGLGDAKLTALIGTVFPYSMALTVLVGAVWVAAIVGIVLLVLGKATGKTPLPFGAFLSTAGIIGILFAHELQFFTGLVPRIF